MFCTSCGSEVAEGLKFCTNCGAPIVPVSQAPDLNEAAAAMENAAQQSAAQTAAQAADPFEQVIQEAPKAPDYNPFEPHSSHQNNADVIPPVVPAAPQQDTYNQQNTYNQQDTFNQQSDAGSQNAYSQQNTYTQQNAYTYDTDADYVQDASKMKTKTALIIAYLLGPIGWLIAWFTGDRNDPLLRFHMNQLLVLQILNIILRLFDDADALAMVVVLISIFLIVCWVIGFIGAIKGQKKAMPLLSELKIIK